jgi:hypothetical protein
MLISSSKSRLDIYLARLHLAFERTGRTFVPALPRDVARNYSFSVIESLKETTLVSGKRQLNAVGMNIL